jgi:putative Holliday junction resolvase
MISSEKLKQTLDSYWSDVSKAAEENFDKAGYKTKLTKMSRILGVDFGEARTGLALSDESRTLAGPLPAWEKRNKATLVEHLQSLVKEYEIDKIVLGFPRNLDGSIGEIAQNVLTLKEQLGQTLGLEIVLWDERLSSVSARRHLKENKISTKKKKSMVDTISAVLILQSYLDSQRK